MVNREADPQPIPVDVLKSRIAKRIDDILRKLYPQLKFEIRFYSDDSDPSKINEIIDVFFDRNSISYEEEKSIKGRVKQSSGLNVTHPGWISNDGKKSKVWFYTQDFIKN